jgi:hypothetical protein
MIPQKARIDARIRLHHLIVGDIERRTIFGSHYRRKNFLSRISTKTAGAISVQPDPGLNGLLGGPRRAGTPETVEDGAYSKVVSCMTKSSCIRETTPRSGPGGPNTFIRPHEKTDQGRANAKEDRKGRYPRQRRNLPLPASGRNGCTGCAPGTQNALAQPQNSILPIIS